VALNPELPVTPSDQEADVLFRVQMKVADLLLGYWKHGLAIVGVILLGTLITGLVSNHFRDAKRAVSEKVSDVDRSLPEPDALATYGIGLPDDLNDPDRVDALTKSAREYEAIGKSASGVAGAEAWIKAGDVWNRLGDRENERKAFQAAWEEEGAGALGYTSGNRLALLIAQGGDHPKAKEILKKLGAEQTGIAAEEALISLMKLARQDGDTALVQETAASYRVRFPKSPRMDVVNGIAGAPAAPSGT